MRVWLREKYPIAHYQQPFIPTTPRSSDAQTFEEQMDHSSCAQSVSARNDKLFFPRLHNDMGGHTEDKPPDGSLLAARKVRMDSVDHELCAEENAGADGREDGEKHLHRPLICNEIGDFDFEGVEGVGDDAEGGSCVDRLHD